MWQWRMFGACRGLDAATFYPETEAQASTAKAVCDRCEVRSECLQYALTKPEKSGVWGGASERDRRRILRQRRATA